MKRLIDSFSVRVGSVYQPTRDGILLESFSARCQETHTPTADAVIAERFNAGVQMFHVPTGEDQVVKSFAVVPGAYDVFGKTMPEAEPEITDILRYRANG